jgi:hypothetical protein
VRMDSRYLYSLRNNAAMGFIVAIGELIDNALQAHATRIVCRMLPGRFVIEDDGLGVSPEGFEACIRSAVIGRWIIPATELAGMGAEPRMRSGGFGA